jgi:hypothetical protein
MRKRVSRKTNFTMWLLRLSLSALSALSALHGAAGAAVDVGEAAGGPVGMLTLPAATTFDAAVRRFCESLPGATVPIR